MPVRHPYLDGAYPRAYAHRGWHLDDLTGCENTMAAFRRAVFDEDLDGALAQGQKDFDRILEQAQL